MFVGTGKRVGRATKLLKPEAVQAEVDARSIAANPFPYNITMEEVEAFFKEHGQVLQNSVVWFCTAFVESVMVKCVISSSCTS